MNKSFKSAILCLFLMLGVIGFLGAAENVKAPHPYQMMNVSGKTAGNSEYSISYPIFEETSLSKLNQLIAKTVADFYLSVMEPDYEDDMSMSYDYSCEYSITFSGKYISILMSVYAYTGGAHGKKKGRGKHKCHQFLSFHSKNSFYHDRSGRLILLGERRYPHRAFPLSE